MAGTIFGSELAIINHAVELVLERVPNTDISQVTSIDTDQVLKGVCTVHVGGYIDGLPIMRKITVDTCQEKIVKYVAVTLNTKD